MAKSTAAWPLKHGTGSATLAPHIVPEQNQTSDEQFMRRFKHQPKCPVIGQGDWQWYAGFPSLNDVLVTGRVEKPD